MKRENIASFISDIITIIIGIISIIVYVFPNKYLPVEIALFKYFISLYFIEIILLVLFMYFFSTIKKWIYSLLIYLKKYNLKYKFTSYAVLLSIFLFLGINFKTIYWVIDQKYSSLFFLFNNILELDSMQKAINFEKKGNYSSAILYYNKCLSYSPVVYDKNDILHKINIIELKMFYSKLFLNKWLNKSNKKYFSKKELSYLKLSIIYYPENAVATNEYDIAIKKFNKAVSKISPDCSLIFENDLGWLFYDYKLLEDFKDSKIDACIQIKAKIEGVAHNRLATKIKNEWGI